ncbi:MAG TPA: hypothetical protein VHB99_12015 [Pirellulales bacterium]|nr:hypothetical protein [Pirellulales bacterium]
MLVALGGEVCWAAPPDGEDANRGNANREKAKPAEGAAREIKFVLEDEPSVVTIDVDRSGRNDVATEQASKAFRYQAIVQGFAPILELAHYLQNQKLVSSPISLDDVRQLSEFSSSAAAKRLREFVDQRPFHYFGDALPPSFQARLISDYDDRIHPSTSKHVSMVNGFRMALAQQADRSLYINLRQIHQAPESTRPSLQEYAFRAASVEEAKQLAKDFLDVYDHSFLPQATKLVADARAELAEEHDKAAPRVAELKERIAAAEKELEGVEQLGETALSDLKVKRSLLKVELAGVEARLSAIDGKLAKLDHRDQESLYSRLVELKVSADVDLASLAAQQKAIDQLIDGQRRLVELAVLRKKELEPLEVRERHGANGVKHCDEILSDLVPFQLIDDTIVIRPVKFELPASE